MPTLMKTGEVRSHAMRRHFRSECIEVTTFREYVDYAKCSNLDKITTQNKDI